MTPPSISQTGKQKKFPVPGNARARYETTGDWRFAEEQPPPPLPPLEQVTGWSKRDPKKKPHHPERALFGGWRLTDWEKKRQKG